MSGRSDRAVFLARATYRQRRLRDGLRILPVLGVVLWLFPLLWRGNTGTSGALQFIFGAWLFLIVMALMMSRRLRDETDQPAEGEGD